MDNRYCAHGLLIDCALLSIVRSASLSQSCDHSLCHFLLRSHLSDFPGPLYFLTDAQVMCGPIPVLLRFCREFSQVRGVYRQTHWGL